LAIESHDPALSNSDISTYALLARGAALAPDDNALSFFLRSEDYENPFRWTHREWLGRITQSANMFRRLGLQRDDVVAFVLPNLPETHWTIWGGETAGIVFAINPMLEAPMMLELMKAARPKLVVTLAPTPGADLWEKVSSVLPQVETLETVLTVSLVHYLGGAAGGLEMSAGRPEGSSSLGPVPVLDFHEALRPAPSDELEFTPPRGGDVASYFCTGGTTGTPKIAVRYHRTEVANAMEIAAATGPEFAAPGRTAFCGLPLFHVNAQIITGLVAWSRGAHVVLGTPQGYRAPGLIQNFWALVEYYRLNWFSGVPTIYSALLQVPRGDRDISSLCYGVCGAAPMPKELIANFQRETGLKILEGYGLTEGGCASSLNPAGGECRVGSIGIRLPWQEMRPVVLGEDGAYLRDAAVGEVGIIAIKGPNLFRGYLNPIHNKGLWIEIADRSGKAEAWLNTGDLGRVDERGYFWLTGRAKELIIRGGHNIDPKMIEEPMHAHPAVALAAAIGRPDAHAGEVPVVYVQLRPGATASEDELMDHARKEVAEKAAQPKRIHVVPSLPTTAVGKIFKPALAIAEMESVLREEAEGCGLVVTHCEAVKDPQTGIVLCWSVDGDPKDLIARMERYAFAQKMI
jgi:acyl-CoA synthetase (AMP-forming)/AMP-acid ligase II